MSTYIIGDVQGCFHELQQLLHLIQFNPKKDRLGFVGDLVNRGPHSLEVLRFIRSLKSPMIVLGNHDFYLLILGYQLVAENLYEHTLHEILHAKDKMELLDWLRHHPLIHYEKEMNALLVHAGLPPQWSVDESMQRAKEVENQLRGPHFRDFLKNLFGNDPAAWNSHLTGQNRLRYINNALTRMRFCDAIGHLDLAADGNVSTDAQHFHPWFDFRDPQKDNVDIFFGHWAALNGHCDQSHCHALDTGCAWGYTLTAIRLEDKKRFYILCNSIKSNEY